MQSGTVEQISAWLAATDIELLELRGPATWLRLRRDGQRVVRDEEPAPPGTDESVPPADVATANAPTTAVTAPSVGVFLRQHPLHTAPLVEPGTAVRGGQALGLLQIGALLLPVSAPHDGIVGTAAVADGAVVGYGTLLFELELPQ